MEISVDTALSLSLVTSLVQCELGTEDVCIDLFSD